MQLMGVCVRFYNEDARTRLGDQQAALNHRADASSRLEPRFACCDLSQEPLQLVEINRFDDIGIEASLQRVLLVAILTIAAHCDQIGAFLITELNNFRSCVEAAQLRFRTRIIGISPSLSAGLARSPTSRWSAHLPRNSPRCYT